MLVEDVDEPVDAERLDLGARSEHVASRIDELGLAIHRDDLGCSSNTFTAVRNAPGR